MMRHLISLIPGALIILSLISCESMETIDESLPLEEQIDKLDEPLVVFGNPNAVIIGIIQNGERSIYSYGDAGLGVGPPLPNTLFEIGSITKTFTATLLSQFIMEGLVSLDDPIDKFLPDIIVPPTFKGEPIRLRHLVTHTSGLPRENYNFDIDFNIVWSETDTEDLYAFLNDISRQAYPFDDYTHGNELQSLGTSFRYSNVGMAILGHIPELVSGQKFEQLVEERICSTLNMDDMLNYMEANMEDYTFLSQSMQLCHDGIYTKEQINAFPRGIDALGMAWFITYECGDTIVYHNGGYNHMSYMKFNRTRRLCIVALSNTATEVGPRVIETIFDWINE